MKLLLDTHLLLWAASSSNQLPQQIRQLLEDEKNIPFFSAASLWEVAIKTNLGRKDFQVDTRVLRRGLLDNGYNELPIESQHAVFIQSLPAIHKDPFDRMLVAQSTVEGITLFTSDVTVAKYPGPIKLVS
jgi:PIN domain nuclease of toxin-antitoxin system